jgi:hypothetical protein
MVALVLAVSTGTPRLVSGDGDEGPSAESVATARASGVKFLSARQDASGSWGAAKASRTYAGGNADNAYTYPLGPTALALYALLASGVPKDDTRIEKGFAWIDRRMQSGATKGFSSYETSAVLLATTARGGTPLRWRRSDSVRLDSDDRRRAQAAVDSLLAVRARYGLLGWRYNLATMAKSPEGDQDLSSTGFAALALFTADRCGLKIPTELWPDLARFAMAQQDETGDEHDRAVDGGLIDLAGKSAAPAAPPAADAVPAKDHARGCAYVKSEALASDEGKATGGVTACAIAILQLSRLLPPKHAVKAWGAKEQASAGQSLLDACAWLDENWSASKNPKKESNDLYHLLYLSHVADAMDLVGSARVGAHAWEREMSEYLVRSQADDGSWNSNSSHEPRAVLDTSFALLFFARPFSAPPAPVAGGK